MSLDFLSDQSESLFNHVLMILKNLNHFHFKILLCAGSDDSVDAGIEFDFLLDGEFLRVPLDKHLENRGVSSVSYVS